MHIPNNDAAYLTGEGLLSINNEEWRGWRSLSNWAALLISSAHAFWNSEASFAATFAVTPIAPTPPRLLNIIHHFYL